MKQKVTLINEISAAMMRTLESPNESDSNGEQANVVDGLYAIARSITKLSQAIEKINPKDGT